MQYRTLGKTGYQIAEIGMGTWQLANDPGCWVGANLSESLQTLRTYVELGGNFIDTAWIYGYDSAHPSVHASEQLIGRFIKENRLRDQIVLASKIAPKNFTWPALHGTPISDVFPNDYIESMVNESLHNLQVETIDLMQFHVWQDDWAFEDGWKQVVQTLIDQGKVRHFGISVNDYQPSNCLKTLDTGLISTIQFIFNIFHQKPMEKLLPYAKAHQIGLIARVPLDEGGLTGKFTTETQFASGDFRAKYFGDDRMQQLVAHTDALKALLGEEAETLVELALRFILSNEAVTTTIPGMRKPDYVRANCMVSDGRILSKALMQTLKKHAWERNFYWTHDPYLAQSNYVEV